MCQTSFVAYENGELIVLSHIPMYKNKHLMKLLEYQPTPIILSNLSNQLTIKPEKPIIAVDEDMTLYSVYTEEEIHHDCWAIHNNHYCKNKNILTRVNYMDCTLALYRKNKEQIQEKCALEISPPHEIIIQLNSTTFYTYTPNQTDLFTNCPEEKQDKNRITGFNIITLKPGCRASLDKHVFSSGIEIEEAITLKQNNMNLNIKDLVKLEGQQEDEFIQLIKEEQRNSKMPVKIVDVTRKYHLQLLKKKGNLHTGILSTGLSMTTIIILVVVAVLVHRACRKKSTQNPPATNTIFHYDREQERVHMTPNIDTTASTYSDTDTWNDNPSPQGNQLITTELSVMEKASETYLPNHSGEHWRTFNRMKKRKIELKMFRLRPT